VGTPRGPQLGRSAHHGDRHPDRTLLLGRGVALVPRRQPYNYPVGITRISVVRIEAPGTIDLAIEPAAADLILGVLSTSPSALQIDFDARRSQRDFYTAPLRDLRRRMSMPKR